MQHRRVLAAIGISVVLLLVILLIGVQTPFGKRLVFDQLRTILAAQGVVLDAEDFDFGLTRLHVSAARVAIRSASRPDLPPLFSADHVSADLGLFDLIRGRYRVNESVITNPRIQVVIDEQGRDNLPPSSSTTGERTDWFIFKMKSTGGSLAYEDRSRNILIRLPAWDLAVDGNGVTDSQEFQFNTRQASEAQLNGKVLTLERIDARVALKQRNQNLEIHEAQLVSNAADITIVGGVENLENPQLDLAVNSNIHLKEATPYLSIEQKIDGDLNLNASVKGRPNELKASGHLKGEDLKAEMLTDIALDADIAYDVSRDRAQLNALQLRSPSLSLTADADVALAAKAGTSTAQARLQAIDLEKFSQLLRLPIIIGSRATATMDASWPGLDFTRLDGTSRIRLAAHQPTRNDRRIPLSGAIVIAANDGKTVASIDSLDAGNLHLRGQVSMQSSKEVSGTLRADTSDAGQALKLIAAWSGSTLPAGFELAGPAGIDANLDGTLERPRVAATVQANGLQVNQLKNINLDALAEYTPQQVDVQRVVVNWEQESVTASGRIGLTSRTPTLDGRAEVPNVSIRRVLSALDRADIPVDGNISIAGTVSGTIENPRAMLELSASDLRTYNEPFGNLSAQAHLENQVVQLDKFLLEKAEGEQLQASGQYNITSGIYGIKADGDQLTLNRVVLPQGTTISTIVSLHTEMSGTLENPNGTLQLSARDLQIDDNAVGAIDLTADVAGHEARVIANAPSYGVTANASVSTLHPYPAEVSVRAADTDIARLPLENLKSVLSGRVSATVNASGDLSDIENGQVRAQVSNVALGWRNRSLTTEGPIDVQYGNRELTISQASVRLDDSTLHVSGTLPLDAGATGELKIDGKTNLATLTDLMPAESVQVQGELVLTGNIRGNFKSIDPDVTVSITGGSINASSLPAPLLGLNLMGKLKDGRIILEQLTAEWASAKITAKGEAPFALLPDLPIEIPRPAGPAQASAEIQALRLSALTQPPQNADGTISVKVEAEASRPQIDLVQARVTFPDLKLNVAGYSLEQVGTSTIEVRNGVAAVQQFQLTGPQTNVHLAGTADLREPGPIDAKLDGTTDAAVLAFFSNAIRATGETKFSIAAAGTLRQPTLTGFVEMQNGQAQIQDPRIAAENLELRLEVNDRQINLTRLEGSLNGGPITGHGYLNLSDSQVRSSELTVAGNGIYLEFPSGVRTVSNAQLNVRGDFPRLTLSGNVDVIEGTYTDPLTIDRGILTYLQSEQSTITVSDQPSALSTTQLDVGLRTLSPLVVNNNIARAEITANLRVSGSIEQPGVTGRIDVEEGAELSLRERKYAVDRGVITFTNDRAIEPILDIAATTSASGYAITMQISGDATRKIETVLTSEPPLDEADIISVLATGRTLEKAGTAGAAIAKEQVLSYVAGELGTSITEEAGRALGLSQVRIEPNLIANEKEPTARLTIGKDITPKLDFIYSMNLRNSNDQIWIADYDITRRFSARGIRQDDNSYRFQFQHDLFFGLGGVPPKPANSNINNKIGSVQFLGQTHLTETQLSSAAGLKTGKTYDFFSVQNARNRLQKTFAHEDRLEARISSDRKLEDSKVDLTFRIKEGPRVEFVFDGWSVPNDLKDQIRNAWSEGVIDAQRVTDVVALIEGQLVRDRYFGSQIDSSIEMPGPDVKRITFRIQPGIRYNDVQLEFAGAHAIAEDELQAALKNSGFFDDDPKKREQAVPLIENLYKKRGYIDVSVEAPRNELNAESKTVRIVFSVTEGPLYRFGQIRFEGNEEFADADLASRVSIEPEAPFDFKTVQQTQQKLQDLYRRAGYDDAVIQYNQVKDVPKTIVDVTFNIQENYQRIFKAVKVEGNQKTSENLVRTQIALNPGDIVSYDKLSQARSNLYNTGAFSFVEIKVTPLEDGSEVKPNQKAVGLVARVREVQPWQLRYGGFYDTDRGPGGIIDFSNHNMLGGARVIGMQTRYDSDLHEVRTYVSQPTLRRLPLKSVITAFQRREIHTGDDPNSATDDFITDRIGFSPTLEYRLRRNNVFTFGYRIEKTHTFEKIPHPIFPFDIRLRVAPLTSSFTRDTRDDPLDASRGRFTSHAFEWGLARLGSDLRYVKYFGQYFAYLPFGKPTVVPWVHTTRNRLVVALGARVGIAKGLGGQDVIPSERFLAGGGTTVRGFQQDLLGPLNPLGAPAGGDAVTVLNSELRFPLYKFFDGVAFVDAGNVYRHLADFKPFDLRASYGFGLRIRTPYIVLRLDYGLKFSPRPGEPRGKFFGSIGQAF